VVPDCTVVVEVTDRDPGSRDVIRIRTITPTAAGRKYVRHNLVRRLVEIFAAPGTEGWPDWDYVEHYRKQPPGIRVVKETAPTPRRDGTGVKSRKKASGPGR